MLRRRALGDAPQRSRGTLPFRRARWVRAAPALLGLRAALPDFVRHLLARRIDQIPGYTGTIEQVDLALWRGAVVLRGLSLLPLPGRRRPIVHIEEVRIDLAWGALLGGNWVADIVVKKPAIFAHLRGETGHPRRRAGDRSLAEALRALPPFQIRRLAVQQAEIHAAGLPGQGNTDLAAHHVFLFARNITNNEELGTTLKASVQAQGRLLSTGRFTLRAGAYPVAQHPTFDVDLQVEQLDLAELQPILRRALSVELRSGRLTLLAEAAAAQGRYHGYVKPVLDGLEVDSVPSKGLLRRAAAQMARVLVVLLKNKRRDRIGTVIDFRGTWDQGQVRFLPAIGGFLKNAFAKALRRRFVNRIRFTRQGREAPDADIAYRPLKTQSSALGRTVGLFKQAVSKWSADDAPRMAASLSYYTAFSLAPLLIIAIAIAGFFFGKEAAQGQIDDQMRGLVGAQGAQAIQSMIQAARKPAAGIGASIIGVFTLLLGASGVILELKKSLNKIWDVSGTSGLGRMLRERLTSFGLILGIGFLLLVSLLLSAALSAAGKYLAGALPFSETAMQLINFAVSFGIITLLFAMIYKLLPDTPISWREVFWGSVVTSLLFTAGKSALGLYLGKASAASSYGAAGSILIILLWVYYSALILYLGAEFTQVHAGRRRSETQATPRIA